jgi:hypothetical protein
MMQAEIAWPVEAEVEPETEALGESRILEILAEKHTQDLFVAHCKTGSSFMGNARIMDAWVMPYSWTKPIIAYEVKCSRSDFYRDRKWRSYLEYCNVFYFVTPHGVLETRDMPPEVGLIWVSKTGKAIRYQKRAPVHFHNIPQSVFQYVLMWRGGKA